MDADHSLPLSRSEERILRALSGHHANPPMLDWVVLQHLKQKGLVEETPTGPKITEKGRRAIAGR